MKKDLSYLYTLKGFACMAVFLEHVLSCFYEYDLQKFRDNLGYSVFAMLLNGRVSVIIFCTISGFLLSYTNSQVRSTDEIRYKLVQRFLSLYIPCALVIIFTYLCMKLKMLGNTVAFESGASEYIMGIYNFEPSLRSVALDLLQIVFLHTEYAPQLWTMRYEFVIGSVVLILLILSYQNRKLRLPSCAILALFSVIVFHDPYAESVFCGVFVGELVVKKEYNGTEHKAKWFALFVLCLCMSNFFYFKLGLASIAALCVSCEIFAGYYAFGTGSKMPIMTSFGKISFSFYLIHFIVICTLGARLFIVLENSTIGHYSQMFILAGSLFVVITIISIIMQHVVILNIGKYTKKWTYKICNKIST